MPTPDVHLETVRGTDTVTVSVRDDVFVGSAGGGTLVGGTLLAHPL